MTAAGGGTRAASGAAGGAPDLLGGTRVLLRTFSVLTGVAFVVLFGLAARTDRWFAWTIEPPATAAFLGAAYGAGCVLVVLAQRGRPWAVVRIPFLTVLVFVVLTLGATVAHLDRFHWDAAGLVPRFAAWLWLAVYVVVPVAMLVTWVREETRRRSTSAAEPDDHAPRTGSASGVPRGLAVVLAAQAAVLLALAAVLLAAPDRSADLWPWALTPLTARVVAAWLGAFAVGTVVALLDGDLRRLELAAWSYVVLAVLELVVLARYASLVRWDAPAAWGYVAFAASVLACSAVVLRTVRRRSPPPGGVQLA